ncbi:MAG: 30S ribosomal protein S9 [Candidatus Omnitrophica bacterium]|nr:30S ribosomal protein S9 [Candidatus Omnitrophota bacterium]
MVESTLVLRKQKDQQQVIAVGRRKTSTARVRILSPGTGKIAVNKKVFNDYFARETHRIIVKQVLKLADIAKKVDVDINVKGGGMSGQAEASRHGLARATVKLNEGSKAQIKKAGLLTRDAREKERKKFGRKKARKRFQFSKR